MSWLVAAKSKHQTFLNFQVVPLAILVMTASNTLSPKLRAKTWRTLCTFLRLLWCFMILFLLLITYTKNPNHSQYQITRTQRRCYPGGIRYHNRKGLRGSWKVISDLIDVLQSKDSYQPPQPPIKDNAEFSSNIGQEGYENYVKTLKNTFWRVTLSKQFLRNG